MPLELLAGPFNVASNEVGGDDLVPIENRSWWLETPEQANSANIPTLGLLLLSDLDSTYRAEMYAAQLDGTAIRIGTRRMPGFNVITAFGWRYDDTLCVLRGDIWQPMQMPSTTPLDDPKDTRCRVSNFAVLEDRIIWVRFGRVRTGGLDDDTTDDNELTVDAASDYGQIFPYDLTNGKSLWWICLGDMGGALYLYDANAKALVAGRNTSFGGDVISAAYSRKHDVFIVTRRDTSPDPDVDQIYVYANEPIADSVSDPAFDDSPRKGGTTTLSAQVLGAMGEPCPGRWVEFAVTAGEVAPATAETDETGTATVNYYGPFAASAGETASATLVE